MFSNLILIKQTSVMNKVYFWTHWSLQTTPEDYKSSAERNLNKGRYTMCMDEENAQHATDSVHFSFAQWQP